jgi:hypothetical protein
LKEKYRHREEYKERMAEIELMGNDWWKLNDSKKNPGQRLRNKK